MLTYAQALEKILSTVQPLPAVESALDDALGKVMAEQGIARWDLPQPITRRWMVSPLPGPSRREEINSRSTVLFMREITVRNRSEDQRQYGS